MKAKRIRYSYLLLGLLLVAELAYCFFNSGVLTGLCGRADRLKVYAVAVNEDSHIKAGDIYDRNGQVIVDNAGDASVYSHGTAYSQMIGFTGNHVYAPMATTVEEVVGSRNDARLMAYLDDDAWGDLGLYETTGIDGAKGQSAVLTIDQDLQLKVYEILSRYLSSSDEIGSVVVMHAQTGEILADVCFPTYDFNNLSEAQAQMDYDARETSLDPGYPITYRRGITPGSIFKMLVAVALIDNGMEDFTVTNETFDVNGVWTCLYTGYYSDAISLKEGDEIDLQTALATSSNVYFAQAALALGQDKMREAAAKFMMIEDQDYIETDFGHVRYHWNPNVSEDVLAQTGYGQGETEWSTIYAAMVTQAIANDGVMMRPYMVRALVDANGRSVYEGKPEKLTDATGARTASKVAAYLQTTALETCKAHGLPQSAAVFERYQVAGKTGTAETGDINDTTNPWFASFAPCERPEYVVIVNQHKTQKMGYTMVPIAAEIYQYLFEEYQ